jgi:hypothetical protein
MPGEIVMKPLAPRSYRAIIPSLFILGLCLYVVSLFAPWEESRGFFGGVTYGGQILGVILCLSLSQPGRAPPQCWAFLAPNLIVLSGIIWWLPRWELKTTVLIIFVLCAAVFVVALGFHRDGHDSTVLWGSYVWVVSIGVLALANTLYVIRVFRREVREEESKRGRS